MLKERVYTVYMHTNLINDKKYIGITKQKPSERWRNGKGYRRNVAFWNAIQKYGWNNFKHEILFLNLTQQEAEMFEIELIKFYKTTNKKFGYNIVRGGGTTFGYRHSLESRKKMSESSKGQICWCKGLKGEKYPLFGKKRPQSVIDKMIKNNPLKKQIICLETLEIFDSISDASRKLNIRRECLRDVCHGRTKSTHNLHFMFLSEYNPNIEYNLVIKKKAHNAKRIVCLNDGMVFDSISEASKYYNISTASIITNLQLKTKSAKGYIFKEVKAE